MKFFTRIQAGRNQRLEASADCRLHTPSKIQLLCSLVLVVALVSSLLLTGCTTPGGAESDSRGSGQSQVASQVVIGSLATEDILPLWVAEAEGFFAEQGIDAKIEIFQSAQELSTAVVAGAVDMAMTDIMVAATLTASGTPVSMEWVTLGTSSDQGRFGIMTSPESGITNLEQLAEKPIGVGSCTVPEYVMDKLLERVGLTSSEIVGEEIKKVPVRYEMMSSNQIAAAALPGSLLALGEATGMVLLADDSTGENLSQSVMIAREDFAQTAEGTTLLESLAQVWNLAVERVNAHPEDYRALLIEKAKLPDPVKESYVISVYPTTERPSGAMVNSILDWMYEKEYLGTALTYSNETGSFST